MALAGDAADTYMNATERLNATDLVDTLVATGQDTTQYKLVAAATTCDGGLTYGPMPQSNSGDFGVDGDYKVCVELTDNAGNPTAYGTSASMTLETVVPAFTSVALANEAADTYISAADALIASDLIDSLVASGHDTVGYKLTTAATTCDGALTYGASIPQNTSGDFGGDGAYKVCVELTDTAGNTPAYGASATINLDKADPVFTSIALTNGASDTYINASENASALAMVGSLVASGYDTVGYKLVAAATTCDTALTYGASEPAGNSADFAADATYKVCVELIDNAGNEAHGASATITLDTAAPAFTSIALAGDAADSEINATENANANDLVDTLVGADYDNAAYKLVTNATTCDGALTYCLLYTSPSPRD